MLVKLLAYAVRRKMPLRLGEAHRTRAQAELNAASGVGIKDSKHLYSLAIDLWMDPTGKAPIYDGLFLEELGKMWETLGGTWGGRFKRRDVPHFEYAGAPGR